MPIIMDDELLGGPKGKPGKLVEHIACPLEGCASTDAMAVYTDGQSENGYCFSCGRYSHNPYGDNTKRASSTQGLAYTETNSNVSNGMVRRSGNTQAQFSPGVGLQDGLTHPVRELRDRKISFSTAEYFNVRIGVSSTDGVTPIYQLFPRFRGGQQVGWKQKTPDKKFINTGGPETDLFGQNLCRPSGKKLWITEGELDALSLYQALKESSTIQGWEPPVVSLPDGAASAINSITRNIDFIDGYEEVILVFDNDPAGIEARKLVCKALAGKVSYVDLPSDMKDPNEMLMAGKGQDLKWLALSHSKKYQPDGIVNAKDLWERYKDKQEIPSFPYPLSMPELNTKTYGVRPGSIVTVTSGSGCGKTQFMRELMYHYYETTDEKIAGLYLEEDVGDTLSGLLALDLGKRITLPDVNVGEEEERESFEKLFGSGHISLYDYFGGMDDNNLLNKLKYFAVTGHRFIFLDHLSIVVSEYAAQGGERERIDTLMTKLAKFVKEFDVVLFLVVHLRKPDSAGIPFEMGAPPTLDALRGSAALKQLSWDVIGLSRNQQHPDTYVANTTELSVLKCRFTGRTGVADYLHFNEETGRMYPVDKPVNYRMDKRGKAV